MPLCSSLTQAGLPCRYQGDVEFEQQRYCRTHLRMKRQNDIAFENRYRQFLQEAQDAEALRIQNRNNAIQQQQQQQQQQIQEQQQQQNQAQDAINQRAQQVRDRKIRKNNRFINTANLLPPVGIIQVAKDLMTIWDARLVPGLEFMKAYALLKYKSSTLEGFPNLIRAVATIVRQGLGNHPIHNQYSNVPAEERETAITHLRTAIVQYGDMTNEELIILLPPGDSFRNIIRHHIGIVQARIARQEARALAHAQLQQDLVENPVVFQRDPEGSINLQAFANDNQSVHRSSVQNMTHRACLILLGRPLAENQDTLPEIVEEFQHPTRVRWIGARSRELAITEITNDYFNTVAFSIPYKDVLDHVWTFIRAHTNREDMILRLAQEVCEGIRMCTNGKMARLVNVLQGFDDTLEMEVPKELFQGRIALLMNLPMEQRESSARSLFVEFQIPEEEQALWLNPLLEA